MSKRNGALQLHKPKCGPVAVFLLFVFCLTKKLQLRTFFPRALSISQFFFSQKNLPMEQKINK